MTEAPAHVGAVFCQSRVMNEQGQVDWRRRRRAGDYGLEQLLITDNPTANGSVLCIRRECFQEAGLFDEALESSVDLEMWLRIAHRARSGTFRSIRPALVDIGCGGVDQPEPHQADGHQRPPAGDLGAADATRGPGQGVRPARGDGVPRRRRRPGRPAGAACPGGGAAVVADQSFGLRMLAWKLLSRPARPPACGLRTGRSSGWSSR